MMVSPYAWCVPFVRCITQELAPMEVPVGHYLPCCVKAVAVPLLSWLLIHVGSSCALAVRCCLS